MPDLFFYEVITNHVKLPAGEILSTDGRWVVISGFGHQSLNFRVTTTEARIVIREALKKAAPRTLLVFHKVSSDASPLVHMILFRVVEGEEWSMEDAQPSWFYLSDEVGNRYDLLLGEDLV